MSSILDATSLFTGSTPTIPINDLRGDEATRYTREERLIRCQLAALCHLIDLNGWTNSIYNQISVKIICSICAFVFTLLVCIDSKIEDNCLALHNPEANCIALHIGIVFTSALFELLVIVANALQFPLSSNLTIFMFL